FCQRIAVADERCEAPTGSQSHLLERSGTIDDNRAYCGAICLGGGLTGGPCTPRNSSRQMACLFSFYGASHLYSSYKPLFLGSGSSSSSGARTSSHRS